MDTAFPAPGLGAVALLIVYTACIIRKAPPRTGAPAWTLVMLLKFAKKVKINVFAQLSHFKQTMPI